MGRFSSCRFPPAEEEGVTGVRGCPDIARALSDLVPSVTLSRFVLAAECRSGGAFRFRDVSRNGAGKASIHDWIEDADAGERLPGSLMELVIMSSVICLRA